MKKRLGKRGNLVTKLLGFRSSQEGVNTRKEYVLPGARMTWLGHNVSDEFIALAGKFGISPERLAKVLCDELVAAKPEMLTIIAKCAHGASEQKAVPPIPS